MNKRTNVALLAEIDQLRTALRVALHLTTLGALGVVCEECGSKVKTPCYDGGPMTHPHEVRITGSREKLRLLLSDALTMKLRPGDEGGERQTV